MRLGVDGFGAREQGLFVGDESRLDVVGVVGDCAASVHATAAKPTTVTAPLFVEA